MQCNLPLGLNLGVITISHFCTQLRLTEINIKTLFNILLSYAMDMKKTYFTVEETHIPIVITITL